ncbi:MAG: hypothetical protein BGO98_06290 [Myxococcales bacterium 68-20]|nr:MAG: hypothetical protein BGO98_06290 [Myxococcales bacterium 68-20]
MFEIHARVPRQSVQLVIEPSRNGRRDAELVLPLRRSAGNAESTDAIGSEPHAAVSIDEHHSTRSRSRTRLAPPMKRPGALRVHRRRLGARPPRGPENARAERAASGAIARCRARARGVIGRDGVDGRARTDMVLRAPT